jgi:hydrogenase nickel incorporation protein HypA/HybF
MHEMAIAEQLIETVLSTAIQNNARKVEEVDLEIGEMRLVVPSALELAFEVVSQGTIVEGAKLNIVERAITMQCNNCEQIFPAEIGNFVCPSCKKAEGRIIEGNEILITSIVCDVDEEDDYEENTSRRKRSESK